MHNVFNEYAICTLHLSISCHYCSALSSIIFFLKRMCKMNLVLIEAYISRHSSLYVANPRFDFMHLRFGLTLYDVVLNNK